VKVAVVTESFLPGINGVTNSVLRVLEHLERQGHTAHVIAAGPGPSEYAGATVDRLRAVPLPCYRSFPVALPTRRVEHALRAFDPDVVHLASPAALGAVGAVAARKLDLPSVAIFQTDLAGFATRYHLRALAPSVWRWLRWVHNHATLTLAPSSMTAWELEQRGIGPVRIWGRGIDLERFNPSHRSDALRRMLAPRGETIVGYVGRLAREKQVQLLAHLVDLDDIRVVIVGDGPAHRKLERRLRRKAHFFGFRSGGDLSRIVASLDVFVHTGANETFCQTVQEALASGVPVITPAVGGPLDLVRHGENGWLFPPGRPRLLRSAAESLARHPDLRAAMGRAARASVVERSWPVLCEQLLDHYRTATAGDVGDGVIRAA
jgi:phosphatidylinositol alpha 1,6-mannosyltransferase